MGREDGKRRLGIRDTEERGGDVVEESMRDECGKHGGGDNHGVEPGKQERLEREEETRHRVCMDAGDKTAHGAAEYAKDCPEQDTGDHAYPWSDWAGINQPDFVFPIQSYSTGTKDVANEDRHHPAREQGRGRPRPLRRIRSRLLHRLPAAG